MMMRKAHAPGPRFQINQRDTASLFTTIGLTILALLAGLLLRESVEGRTQSYTATQSNVQVQYPDAWRLDASGAGDTMVRVTDPDASGAPTTFELQAVTVEAEAEDSTVFGTVSQNLTLTRARNLQAYKQFDLQLGQSVNGQPAATGTYVFVQTPNNLLANAVPSVMFGEDRMVRKGNTVYVFSSHATEENRDRAAEQFNRFVESARLP